MKPSTSSHNPLQTQKIAGAEEASSARTETGQNPDTDVLLRRYGLHVGQVDPARARRMQEVSRQRRDGADEVPALWNAGYAGVRIISAYRTLIALPITVGPRGYKSNWPEMIVEFQDQVAQVVTGELGKGRNRVVRAAPIEEINAMDKVFAWFPQVLKDVPDDSKMLQRWGLYRALNRDLEPLAEEMQISYRNWRRLRREAANLLAARLNKASVATF